MLREQGFLDLVGKGAMASYINIGLRSGEQIMEGGH